MMERKDVAALSEQVFEDFLAQPPKDVKNYSIRMTSGTTGGGPFLTIWERKDGSSIASGSRRFMITFGPRAMRLSNLLFFRTDPKNAGALAMVADVADAKAEDGHLVDEFAPDRIYGFPSFTARVAEHTSAETGRGVNTIGLSGEALSKDVRGLFSEKFPNARIVMTWAAAEAGVISKPPCEFLKENQYHPRDEVHIDIQDPDETGAGLLLISKTLYGGHRIEQYRTGDVARLLKAPCPCGETITFELLGRAGYDFIKLVGAILRREEFDRVVRLCTDHFDDYRVEAEQILDNGTLRGRVTLKIFREAAPVEEDARRRIETTFAKNVFVSVTQTIADVVGQGIFLPFRVETSTEPFPRGSKDFKLSLKNS